MPVTNLSDVEQRAFYRMRQGMSALTAANGDKEIAARISVAIIPWNCKSTKDGIIKARTWCRCTR